MNHRMDSETSPEAIDCPRTIHMDKYPRPTKKKQPKARKKGVYH